MNWVGLNLFGKEKDDEKDRSCNSRLAIFSLLFTLDSFAQMGPMWKGSGGWGMGMQYSKMYNPKTVETIIGVVVSVDKITPMKGMSHGML